jgi:hypothetical protein
VLSLTAAGGLSLEHLAELVGQGFLSFTTATEPGDAESVAAGARDLTDGQRASLAAVLGVASSSAAQASQVGGSERSFLYDLIAYNEEASAQVPNLLRQQAGGELPDIPSGIAQDTPEHFLAELARDLYATTLLASDRSLSFQTPHSWEDLQWFGVLINHHPALERFQRSVEADAELARLFPNDTPESGKHGSVILNLGLGRGIQLSMLAYDLLTAVYKSLKTRGELRHDQFVEEAMRSVTTLRSLLAGETVNVVARYAIVGVEIADSSTFALPWGVLRSPTFAEREAIAGGPTPRTQEVVLEMAFPLAMRAQASLALDDGDWQREVRELHGAMHERVRLTQLLLLLALDRTPLVATAQTWTLIDNPVGQHPLLSWWRDPRTLYPHVLTAADAQDLAAWSERLERSYDPSIAVAQHRILSALAARDDPADGLIDAVIALENLFAGTETGELVFRISAASAFLLRPDDPTSRAELQTEVKRLYERRSRIVHGAVLPDPSEIEPDRLRAAELCVESLRELFKNHPLLVSDRKRGTKLILGTAPKHTTHE